MTITAADGSTVVSAGDTLGKGMHAQNGSMRVTLVSGTTYTGLYNADGSINVYLDEGNIPGGAYHPCGALRVSTQSGFGARAPNGALRVSNLSTLNLDFTTGVLDPRITFSRASNAMLTDSTGKITYAPNNLLLQSQTFDNASWVKTNITVTGGFTAPDSTLTAQKLEATTTALTNIQQSAVISGSSAVYSMYIKKGSGAAVSNRFLLRNNTTATNLVSVIFNYDTGAITYGSGAFSSGASATDVGNGWWRLQIVPPSGVSAGNTLIVYAGYIGTSATAGDFCYVWGAQLEAVTYQTTPSTYNATTTAVYYGPRFDYDPVTLAPKGLLIEEARTNVITNSENAASFYTYQSQATIGSASSTTPSGLPTVDKIVEGSGSVSPLIAKLGVSFSAATHTYSLYAKAAGRAWLTVGFYDGTAAYTTYFNVSTGVVGTNPAGTTATISAAGNGWFRCVITRALPSTASGQYRLGLANADNGGAYTGDGSSGVLIWGSQSETGASATSYIPTGAASVARSADLASMTGTNFTSWFNQGPVNLLTYSQTFDDAAWTKLNATITANSTTAPDGTTTADTMTDDATSGQHRISQLTLSASTNYTMSIYAKANTHNFVQLLMTSGSGTNGWFTVVADLSGGTISQTGVGTSGTLLSSRITSVGSGWYRISMTGSVSTASPAFRVAMVPVGTGNSFGSTDGTISYVGTGTSLYLWGAQLEVGQIATPYAVTTTAPASLQPATGTFVAKADAYSVTAYSPLAVARLSSTAIQNSLDLSTNNGSASAVARFTVRVASVVQADVVVGVPAMVPNTAYTFAGAFATNDIISASQNAVSTPDTSAAIPAADVLDIGQRNNVERLNGHIQYLRYYAKRLSNTILQGSSAQ